GDVGRVELSHDAVAPRAWWLLPRGDVGQEGLPALVGGTGEETSDDVLPRLYRGVEQLGGQPRAEGGDPPQHDDGLESTRPASVAVTRWAMPSGAIVGRMSGMLMIFSG